MKVSEAELADVGPLMKKIKASSGQSMQRKSKDRTEDRCTKGEWKGKVNRHKMKLQTASVKIFNSLEEEEGLKICQKYLEGENPICQTQRNRERESNVFHGPNNRIQESN